jgi:hypothetical protein
MPGKRYKFPGVTSNSGRTGGSKKYERKLSSDSYKLIYQVSLEYIKGDKSDP